jgi:hypothetical protein
LRPRNDTEDHGIGVGMIRGLRAGVNHEIHECHENGTDHRARAQRSGARAQRSGNRLRGSLAGGLPRRTPRARRGREKIRVGSWMVTTDVVIGCVRGC